MTKKQPISFGSLGVECVSSLEKTAAVARNEGPFRILVMGDFSGRESRGIVEPLHTRRIIPVDRDDIEDVLARLHVRLRLDLGGEQLDLTFADLDDFHPDRLFERLAIFRDLKEMRRQLDDPRTYNTAVQALRRLAGMEAPSRPITAPVTPAEQTGGSLLDRMLAAPETGSSGQDGLETFVEAIVRPHLVLGKDPEQETLKAALDAYISELMRLLLHHPAFQALESVWRGMHFLVTRTETDENLRIHILDVTLAELTQDLCTHDDLSCSALYGLLMVDLEEPWAVLMGSYCFDYADAGTLGRLSLIARAAGAPFIAQAHAHLIGCETPALTPDPHAWRYAPDPATAEAWDALRRLSEVRFIGLVLPCFLLRLPYGRDTDPIEHFAFEELGDYLWGNPAFACAYLLARAFTLHGWDLRPGVCQDIEGLPLHTIRDNDGSRLQPCAEVLLGDQALEAILARGIMALACLKDTDVARLVHFQSIADPPAGLSGRWHA